MSNHTHASRLQSPTRPPRRLPATSSGGTIQRQTLAHKTEGDPIAQLEQALQSGFQFDRVPVQSNALGPSTGGHPLPIPLQQKMGTAFQTDFSDVRIHQDSSARQLGVLAYTRGNHIHFAPGRYQPDSLQGQHILAHELSHTVQQRMGRVAGMHDATPTINLQSELEAEADASADKAVRGDTTIPRGARADGNGVMFGNTVQCMINPFSLLGKSLSRYSPVRLGSSSARSYLYPTSLTTAKFFNAAPSRGFSSAQGVLGLFQSFANHFAKSSRNNNYVPSGKKPDSKKFNANKGIVNLYNIEQLYDFIQGYGSDILLYRGQISSLNVGEAILSWKHWQAKKKNKEYDTSELMPSLAPGWKMEKHSKRGGPGSEEDQTEIQNIISLSGEIMTASRYTTPQGVIYIIDKNKLINAINSNPKSMSNGIEMKEFANGLYEYGIEDIIPLDCIAAVVHMSAFKSTEDFRDKLAQHIKNVKGKAPNKE